jgi:hypothetical protein
LTEIKSEALARQLIRELEPLSPRWPVGMGGQGARAIEHLLQDARIELLDDLPVLHSRLMNLISSKMLASRG